MDVKKLRIVKPAFLVSCGLILVLLLPLFGEATSFTGDPSLWNGYHWEEMTDRERFLFIAGTAAIANAFLRELFLVFPALEKTIPPFTMEELDYGVFHAITAWYGENNKEVRILEVLEYLDVEIQPKPSVFVPGQRK